MEIVIIYPVLTKKVTNIDQKCQNYKPVYNSICRPHISVGVRVNSSSGLIFYVAGGKGQRTMTLSVFDGHLMLMVNGGKRKTSIRSKKKYNDGLWHTVRMWMSHDFRHTFVIVFLILSMNWCRCLWEWRLTGPLWQWTASTPRTRGWRAEGRVCLVLLSISVDFPQTTAQLW